MTPLFFSPLAKAAQKNIDDQRDTSRRRRFYFFCDDVCFDDRRDDDDDDDDDVLDFIIQPKKSFADTLFGDEIADRR